MTNDPYKGMVVTYNFLNLPTQMQFGNAFTGTKTIDVLYDASGRKLRKIVTDGTTQQYRQDYVGGIEYRSTSTVSLSLESIYHPEGRVFNINTGTTSANALRYEYSIKDHLGNTRLNFTDKNANGKVDVTTTASNEILSESHYYPFGMAMSGPWMDDASARDNQYKYNGKELNSDFGLGWYDYGARWYDASVGRWWAVDPLAEQYTPWSGYNYVVNNPVRMVDPDGMAPGDPEVSSTASSYVTFSYDKNSTLGTDHIKTLVTTTTVQRGNSGEELYRMSQTTMTTADIDADGNVGSISQATTTVITANSTEGLQTSTTIDSKDGVKIAETSSAFQEVVNNISEFKKNNEGLSPVQEVANQNAEKAETWTAAGEATTIVGGALAFFPTPQSQGASKILTGLGKAISAAGVVTYVGGKSNETNPEKIKLKY